MSKDDLEKLLAAFADAWNRHDVDGLMSMMTDDGVFDASGGNHVSGERHEGQSAVRAAYAAVFAQYPDAHWGNARHLVTGQPGSVRVDLHRDAEGWQAGRGQWLRPVYVSERQDCDQELVQKESTTHRVRSPGNVDRRPSRHCIRWRTRLAERRGVMRDAGSRPAMRRPRRLSPQWSLSGVQKRTAPPALFR